MEVARGLREFSVRVLIPTRVGMGRGQGMRGVRVSTAWFIAGLCAASPGFARVMIDVDLGAQRMRVASPSGASYDWPISSGSPGHPTPRGTFWPVALYRMTHSYPKYDNEPMPFTIVFFSDYAIHGSSDVEALGRPVSHGCVRLATDNAEMLFTLVQHEGAIIRIEGETPAPERDFGYRMDR